MDECMLTNKDGLTEEEFLKNYDADIFKRPSVTVDMLIFSVFDEEVKNYRKLPQKSLKLLLVKRKDHPYIKQWALPGGFVAINESLDEAAKRELKSETNIDNIYMEQLYTWGDVDRDPRTRVISASYMALVDRTLLDIKAGDDAEDALWFDIKSRVIEEKKINCEKGYTIEKVVDINISNKEITLGVKVKVIEIFEGRVVKVERDIIESKGIAFDHAKIIEYALERLKNKIEYTDIAFNLMPELFTLSELQQVYEIILDKELLAAAFRRKVAEMVIETDHFTKDAGHRPSKFYRFNPLWRNGKDNL
ncbi:MAG: NUDIX domain-containing protein [Bacillota bacterium]|nr:NUDIX domain-containing protein [Bacillota bacterium]